MRHYRWCIAVMSSLLLTWCKDTCSWQWQKKTSRRSHLEQVLQVCMSLLICFWSYQMLGQASAGWWSNVLVISSLSPCCCILMISVFLLQMLALCWTWIELVLIGLTYLIWKSSQRIVIFFRPAWFSGPCLVSQRNICQPRKDWQSKGLASAKECQGVAFIPRFGILLSLFYPKLCLHGQMITPTNWSNQHQEDKK